MKSINKKIFKKFYCRPNYLIIIIFVLLTSCQSDVNELDGEWTGKSILISVNLKENTIEIKNDLKPKENFRGKILSFENKADDKWEIKLNSNKKIILKTFNQDTLFIYDENGYSRLKKQLK
jgi:hypothetical protein